MGNFRVLVKSIVQHEDRFLIVEKWYDDRIVDPYQWEFVNGELEFGEEPEMAAVRLLEEKVGITAEVSEILYSWGFTAGEVCTVGIAYQLVCEQDEVVLAEEITDYKWVLKDEIDQYVTNQAILEDLTRSGLTKGFKLDNFGKEGKFIERLD